MSEHELVARLRDGDEAAFRELVARWGGRLRRLARAFARDETVIEEAVQETWIAVFRGVHAFEGRSPLRSWLFAILVNHARKLAVREHRQARLASEGGQSPGSGPPLLGPGDRPPGMDRKGRWSEPPRPWGAADPASILLGEETRRLIEEALDQLPEAQRQVLLLRQVEGLEPTEVCNILQITDTHQRVLLHRGRLRIREALDRSFREDRGGAGSPGGREGSSE
jgi:RNA polymerase sigma-70 factor (ECF subfamily)